MGVVTNLKGGTVADLITELLMRSAVVTLAGNLVLGALSEPLQILDPGGASRNVDLPPEADSVDLMFIIVNIADAVENLVVRNDAAATIATVDGSAGGTANQTGIFHCDGVTWRTVLTATRDVS